MPGIVGDTAKIDAISQMADSITYEKWYKCELYADELPAFGIVHHGQKDPTGYTIWKEGSRGGVIYGEITNKHELIKEGYIKDKESKASLFEPIFERPAEILPKLDGSFIIACIDREEQSVTLATDKLGSRSCFYADIGKRFLFASELKAVLTQLDKCTINEHAIADFLAFGFIFGEKTFIKEIQGLQPATILKWQSGIVSKTKYWNFVFTERKDESKYVEKLITYYEDSVRNTCRSLQSNARVGLELSGGLDSRILAKVLSKYLNFKILNLRTFSYDSNPRGGGNVVIAREVAEVLDLQNEETEFDVDDFAPLIKEGVKRTDGMVSWIHFHNLPFHLSELAKRVDILIDGSGQGELFGENIIPEKLDDNSLHEAVIETLKAQGFKVFNLELEEGELKGILRTEFDPVDSIKEELERSISRNNHGKIMEVLYNNFYPNFHFRSAVKQTKVGVRNPLINTKLLELLARMPRRYYRRHVRGTFGRIPQATSELKFEVVRKLNGGIEKIPYERSNLNPKMPLIFHTIGMLIEYLKRRFGHTKGNVYAQWIRENAYLRELVIELLDSLCERDLFNEKVIKQLEKEHIDGTKDNPIILGRLTTLEIWLQEVLDKNLSLKKKVLPKKNYKIGEGNGKN
jgi:asparagine synthase (glutamine-hydrolysing)